MRGTVPLLDRPVYSYAEADRLLRVSPGTARRWINGYERAGVAYPPVIREATTDSRWVTWGEFVEARLLAEFRRGVPRHKFRPVIAWLRNETGATYPLSGLQIFLEHDGRDLLLRAQAEASLDAHELQMVFPVASRGALLTAPARRFLGAVRLSADNACRSIAALHADGSTPAVVLNPYVRQGQPSAGNIPTARLAELVRAGDSLEAVADGYAISQAVVEQAVTFEADRRLTA